MSKSGLDNITDATLSQWISLHKEEVANAMNLQIQIQNSNKELDVLKERNVIVEQKEALQKLCDERTVQVHQIEKKRRQILAYLEAECHFNDISSQSCDQDIFSIFEQSRKRLKTLLEEREKHQTALGEYISVLHLIDKFISNKRIEADLFDLRKQEEEKRHLRDACREEIDGIQHHLEKFVDSYFELDLINRLYNAIDPHPDYKEIQFKCDFKLKNPRLKVLLNSREDGKDSIVPNLYFSTAQINILSFCIFLAKALFTTDNEGKNIDCIFIDDPIQGECKINCVRL